MPLKLKSTGGGDVTLDVPSTASTYTLTAPARTGSLAVDGPAFRAYLAANQTITSGSATKIAFDTEDYDTASCFNTSTSRFTPNVAGYYLFSVTSVLGTNAAGSAGQVNLYKNGSNIGSSGANFTSNSSTLYGRFNFTALVYMNGTTDYVEGYGAISATNPYFTGGSASTHFSGCLVRAE